MSYHWTYYNLNNLFVFYDRNQIDSIMTRYNEINIKCETLTERQNTREKELLTKTERVSYAEAHSLILINIILVFINIILLFSRSRI